MASKKKEAAPVEASEEKMQAVYHKKFGDASADMVGELKKPTEADLKPGQVLVKTHAAALNPVDVYQRTGKMPKFFTPPLPVTYGLDFCGEVIASKPESAEKPSKFNPGDMVYGMTKWLEKGTLAEYLIASESVCCKKPGELTPVEAASLPLVGLTALTAFQQAGFEAGNPDSKPYRVLILGGAGGLGTVAIQIAKNYYKAFVATTASPGKKTELCTSLGADLVINYKEDADFKGLEGLDKFDFIFHLAGSLNKAMRFIKECGKVIGVSQYPTADGLKVLIDKAEVKKLPFGYHTLLNTSFGRSVMNRVTGARPMLKLAMKHKATYEYFGVVPYPGGMELLSKQVDEHKLKPVIDKTFTLKEGKEALAYVEAGKAAGKVCITCTTK